MNLYHSIVLGAVLTCCNHFLIIFNGSAVVLHLFLVVAVVWPGQFPWE